MVATQQVVALLALWLCSIFGAAENVDISNYRTDKVKSSFDPAKADGLWYEIAFEDPAQAGARCQTVDDTFDKSTGEITQIFSVKYPLKIPYKQTLTYEPDKSGKRGVYTKYMQGAKALLQLPTVVVDVKEGTDGKYSMMTEFTDKRVVVSVTELRLLARTPTITDEELQMAKKAMASTGLPQKYIDILKISNHSGCSSSGSVTESSSGLDDALILQPPAGKTGTPAAWIVLPGAQIGKDTYKDLAVAVQKAAPMPLWVAVLGTAVTPSPIPPEIGPRIDHVLNTMKSQGLDLDHVKLFYGGHSLGSVFIQDHLAKYHGKQGPMGGKIQVLGQVLMGGFIQRKYYTFSNSGKPSRNYPVSTLTVGGELDGLARCTRLAEAFYTADNNAKFPVVIIPGLTHMQFSSGTPPALVKARDLVPEITYDQAHAAIAKVVASYFGQVAKAAGTDASALTQAIQATASFAKPIIAAYELEGARYFNAPAQIGGPLEKTCVKGGCQGKSNWAPEAQKVISEISGWTLDVSNEYVSVSSTPLTGEEFHLPAITHDDQKKSLHITTYSQNYFDDAQPSWFGWKEIFDKFDTGFVATSAEEIGTKLYSRQCTFINGLGKNTSFDVDKPQFCSMTNAKAYEWAQKNAASTTLSRFQKYGQKYTFADDLPKSGGPLFIDAHLQFNKVKQGGEQVISVAAPMQKTEIDYWKKHFGPIPRPSAVPDPGCFHYCKLLSPARAMEWIYVDSLRLKKGLTPGTEDTAQKAVYV